MPFPLSLSHRDHGPSSPGATTSGATAARREVQTCTGEQVHFVMVGVYERGECAKLAHAKAVWEGRRRADKGQTRRNSGRATSAAGSRRSPWYPLRHVPAPTLVPASLCRRAAFQRHRGCRCGPNPRRRARRATAGPRSRSECRADQAGLDKLLQSSQFWPTRTRTTYSPHNFWLVERSYPAGWMAVVHLFCTVVLVGIGQIGETAIPWQSQWNAISKADWFDWQAHSGMTASRIDPAAADALRRCRGATTVTWATTTAVLYYPQQAVVAPHAWL